MRRILAASLVILLASCSSPATAESPTSVIATTPNISQEPVTITAPTATTAPPISATPQPTALRWQPIVDGLSQPVALAHTDDDRLFVVEKAGTIRIVQGGALAANPFLDIRARVGSRDSEQGLLGLVFHPRFRQNGFFFVDYTDVQGNTVIARYHAGPGSMTADPRQRTRHPARPAALPQSQWRTVGVWARWEAVHRPRRRRLPRRPQRQRPEPGHVSGQAAAHRRRCGRPLRYSGGQPLRARWRPPRDLGLRAAQSVAVHLRPPHRRSVHRRRRSGRVGGDRLPARRRARRCQLRVEPA